MLLLAAGALISGFTILRRIDPFDEGVVLEAARRVMQGQLPHQDFLWAYGPADPYLMAGLFKSFGVSLLDCRILRVVSDAASALAVFIEASCCREPRRTMTAVVRTTIRAGWSGTLDRHCHTALVLRV